MFYVGVDLGQKRDFTAIAVAERALSLHAWMPSHDRTLAIRYLARVPLGTPYTMVARRVQTLVWQLNGNCSVAIDATGLGAPVVDLLREANLACELAPVVITGGDKQNHSAGVWRVPKRDLIGGLQLLLEKGDLQICKQLRESGALVRELIDMRTTTLRGATEHDDLVMAVALACWQADRATIGYGNHRLPGT